MSFTWFKLHHDIADDIKLRRFTPQEKWAWVALLCLGSKARTRGVIQAEDEDISQYCEFNSTQDWLYYRDKLIAKGMLDFSGDGNLTILHWQDRQYDNPSDRPEAVKSRVAKHRAAKKAASNEAETTCNDDVTTQTRSDQTRSDQTRSDQTRSDPDPDQEGLETREPVKQKILDPIPRQMDPEPTPLRQDPGSWRKYLDPDSQVLSTPLPTPWRIRNENQQLKNHPGFVEFLKEQYEGKISMAVGFLTNARKDPDRNEAAHELWDHYIKTNSAEAATVAGIDPLDAFPHKSQWLDYIEANGRMQFELNYPGGTKRERMQFTDILIEDEKRAKQEQK